MKLIRERLIVSLRIQNNQNEANKFAKVFSRKTN